MLTQVFKVTPANTTDPEYRVVIINTFIMDVDSATEATGRNEAFVTVAPRTVAAPGYAYGAALNNIFETDAFEKDDVVLITAAFDDKGTTSTSDDEYVIQTMQLAESLRGEMTRYTETANTMRVDDVTYSFDKNSSQNANEYTKTNAVSKVGTDVQIYLDNYGYAIEVDGVQAAAQINYALVIAVDKDSAEVFNENSAWVKLVMMDGSVVPARFTWDDDETSEWSYDDLTSKNISVTGASSAGARSYITNSQTKTTLYTNIQTLVTYTYSERNDIYTLKKLGAANHEWQGLVTDTNRSIASNKGGASDSLFMNNTTVLLTPSNKGNDQYSVTVGVRTMPKIDSLNPTSAKTAPTQAAQESGTSLVNVIYTETKEAAVVEKDLIYIAAQNEYVNDKVLGPYVNFTAVINGEIVELMVRGEADENGVVTTDLVMVGALYSGVTYDRDDIVTKAVSAIRDVDYLIGDGIIRARKDVIGIGTAEDTATYYTWSDDVLVAYIDVDGADNIVVSNPRVTALRTEDDASAIYGVATDNAGEITWLYVVTKDAKDAYPIISSIGEGKTYNAEGEESFDNIIGTLNAKPGADVTIEGDVEGTVSVENGATVTIKGDVDKNADITVEKGGVVIIEGTQNAPVTVTGITGNIHGATTAKSDIVATMPEGGLIVLDPAGITANDWYDSSWGMIHVVLPSDFTVTQPVVFNLYTDSTKSTLVAWSGDYTSDPHGPGGLLMGLTTQPLNNPCFDYVNASATSAVAETSTGSGIYNLKPGTYYYEVVKGSMSWPNPAGQAGTFTGSGDVVVSGYYTLEAE